MISSSTKRRRIDYSFGLAKTESPNHRRKLQRKREWEEARDKFKTEQQRPDGTWLCFHCGLSIPTWEEAVVDHFPHPKGRRPDLLCDPKDFVMSHSHCNVSGASTRKDAREHLGLQKRGSSVGTVPERSLPDEPGHVPVAQVTGPDVSSGYDPDEAFLGADA